MESLPNRRGDVRRQFTAWEKSTKPKVPHTALPTSRHARIDSQFFRLLLCKRFRFPILVAAHLTFLDTIEQHAERQEFSAATWRSTA